MLLNNEPFSRYEYLMVEKAGWRHARRKRACIWSLAFWSYLDRSASSRIVGGGAVYWHGQASVDAGSATNEPETGR